MEKIILSGKNIGKKFGGLLVLHELSFAVEEGKISGLIGPNGAGKTTLFNVITNMLMKDSGEVFIKETNISKKKTHEITRLGCVRTYQGNRILLNLTTYQNIWYARNCATSSGLFAGIIKGNTYHKENNEDRKKIEEIVDFLKIGNKLNKLARELSFGDQTKVRLAMALATEPIVVLMH